MFLFVQYLTTLNFTVHTPHWEANSCHMPGGCVLSLEKDLAGQLNKSEPLIVIGNSMGGVLAYHLPQFGWNVQKAFYVAAPLTGSAAIRWTTREVSRFMAESLVGAEPYVYLSEFHKIPPPQHEYWTITPRLFTSDFDTHVWTEDSVLDPSRDLPIYFSSHFGLIADSRLWREIAGRIVEDFPHSLSEEQHSSIKLISIAPLTIVASVISIFLTLPTLWCWSRKRKQPPAPVKPQHVKVLLESKRHQDHSARRPSN